MEVTSCNLYLVRESTGSTMQVTIDFQGPNDEAYKVNLLMMSLPGWEIGAISY